MKAIPLDAATIAELLKPQERLINPITYANNQKGPLRWYDREMRCASRNCSSPTFIKIDGVPKCSAHAVTDLNDIVLRLEDKLRECHAPGY